MKNYMLYLGLLAIIFSGCKYEDGPAISLRTKKDRVANVWTVEKATDDGNDVTSNYDEYTLTLKKDGDASLLASYSIGDITYQYETDGTWEFNNSKENLELDFEDNDADRTYAILRLTDKEMWLREKGEDLELKLTGV